VLVERGLFDAFDERPEAALTDLHQAMVAAQGDPDLLFALAELVVKPDHSARGNPQIIEEVRRICGNMRGCHVRSHGRRARADSRRHGRALQKLRRCVLIWPQRSKRVLR
jgi:hypothetical protein